jgi:predicted regulator of Ras-like GTPase activity (Roadblock/LC7/MglB family)
MEYYVMSEQFSYVAAIHSFSYSEKKGIFYLINTSPNKNMWGVSTTALADGLPTVLNKPLGMGKNYRKGHFNPEDSMNSGIFTAHENKGNYALGTAEISDQKTLDKMRTGELNAVSVVITPHKIVCSKCGQQLPDNTRPGQLHCQNSPLTVESFVFDRVDFVDNPAYPQAGLLKIAAEYLQSNTSTPLSLTAAVYECSQTQNSVKILKSEKMMSDPKIEIEKIEAQVADFSKTCADLSSRLTAAETGLAALKAENDKAKAELHAALIEKVFTARKAAGITVLDDTVERTMLSGMTASALNLLLTEAEKKKATMQAETIGASNPKFNKTQNTVNSLAAALQAQREELTIPVVEEDV